MFRLLEVFANVQQFRNTLRRMPAWARLIVGLVMLPGLLLVLLSIAALLVSILALLLLTNPVYRMLAAATGARGRDEASDDEDARSERVPDLVEPESVTDVTPEDAPAGETAPAPSAGEMAGGEVQSVEVRPGRRPVEVRIIE